MIKFCRVAIVLVLFGVSHSVSGSQCDPFTNNCPGPFEECCLRDDGFYQYECCPIKQYYNKEGLSTFLIITIGVIFGALVASCLCCLCCPCCLLYKRRNRGTVYGRVQTTVVTTAHQQNQPPAAGFITNQQNMLQQQQQSNLPYPVQPPPQVVPAPVFSYPGYVPMPQAPDAVQPPPYNVAVAGEVYAKQVPYNPAFQQ